MIFISCCTDNTAQLLVAQGLQSPVFPFKGKNPATPYQGLCSTLSIVTQPLLPAIPWGQDIKSGSGSPSPLPRGRQDVILAPGGKLSPCTNHCLANPAAEVQITPRSLPGLVTAVANPIVVTGSSGGADRSGHELLGTCSTFLTFLPSSQGKGCQLAGCPGALCSCRSLETVTRRGQQGPVSLTAGTFQLVLEVSPNLCPGQAAPTSSPGVGCSASAGH